MLEEAGVQIVEEDEVNKFGVDFEEEVEANMFCMDVPAGVNIFGVDDPAVVKVLPDFPSSPILGNLLA